MDIMPKWVDIIIVPFLSLFLAAFLSALLIIAIGESPIAALNLMIEGTLLRSAGWGYMPVSYTHLTLPTKRIV